MFLLKELLLQNLILSQNSYFKILFLSEIQYCQIACFRSNKSIVKSPVLVRKTVFLKVLFLYQNSTIANPVLPKDSTVLAKKTVLFQFLFSEKHMFVDSWIVFHKLELPRQRLRIPFLDVKESSSRRGHQLDKNRSSFLSSSH